MLELINSGWRDDDDMTVLGGSTLKGEGLGLTLEECILVWVKKRNIDEGSFSNGRGVVLE